MEKEPGTLGSLFEKTGDYLETRLELLKLQAIDKTSDVTSSVISRIATVLILTFAVVMANIGLAVWVGELVGRMYLGFFIVAAFYALLAWLIHLFRKAWIKEPITHMLIKKMLN
jgi:putative superfamily III holin-X